MTVEELGAAITEAILESSGLSEGDTGFDSAFASMETLGAGIAAAVEDYVATQREEIEEYVDAQVVANQ